MEDRQWVWQHYGTCPCAKNREGQAGTGEKYWKVGVKHSEGSMGIFLPARVTGSPAHIWGCAAKRLADHSWVQPSMTLESRWCLWWDYAYIYTCIYIYIYNIIFKITSLYVRICTCIWIFDTAFSWIIKRERERSHALRVSKWWNGCWKSCGKKVGPHSPSMKVDGIYKAGPCVNDCSQGYRATYTLYATRRNAASNYCWILLVSGQRLQNYCWNLFYPFFHKELAGAGKVFWNLTDSNGQ